MLRIYIAFRRIDRRAVLAEVLVAGLATLNAWRSGNGSGAEFYRDSHTDLLANGKAADSAVSRADISHCYDRVAAAARDRRANACKGGYRHRHADSGSLIPDYRAPFFPRGADGAADSQPFRGLSAAEQTDVDSRYLACYR